MAKYRDCIFTCKLDGYPATEALLLIGLDFDVVIGPEENNKDGTNTHRHGVFVMKAIHTGQSRVRHRENKIRGLIVEEVQKKGLGIDITYVSKMEGTLIEAVKYALKTMSTMPTDIADWLANMMGGQGKWTFMFEKGYSLFGKAKPDFADWSSWCLTENMDIPDLQIKRGYNKYPKHHFALQPFVLSEVDPVPTMSVQEMSIALDLILNNTDKVKWHGQELNKTEYKIILSWLSLEQIIPGERQSPHYIITGYSGSGKSLLSNLLLIDENTKKVAVDNVGVGIWESEEDQRIYSIEEATRSFFYGKSWNFIKGCFHAKNEIKTHGTTKRQQEMVVFMTTNLAGIEDKIGINPWDKSEDGDEETIENEKGAFQRRFVLANMKKGELRLPYKDRKRITPEIQSEFIRDLCMGVAKKEYSGKECVAQLWRLLRRVMGITTTEGKHEVSHFKSGTDVLMEHSKTKAAEKRKLKEMDKVPNKKPKETPIEDVEMKDVSKNNPTYNWDTIKYRELPDALANNAVSRIKTTAQRLRILLVVKPIYEAPCLICEDIIEEEPGKPILEYRGHTYIHIKCFKNKYKNDDTLLKDVTCAKF